MVAGQPWLRTTIYKSKMLKINSIKAREILNSKKEPTVEAEVETIDGVFYASVPSGTSCGKYEAVSKPASEAIKNIQQIIAPKLSLSGFSGLSAQKKIDETLIALDATEDKSRLGANAILAVSIACCRAGAAACNLPLYHYIAQTLEVELQQFQPVLPRPCFNILEGGAHANNDLALQEFMVVPECDTFRESLDAGIKIYHALKKILKKKFGSSEVNIGQEGGLAPSINGTKQALDLLIEAIKEADYEKRIKIGLDCAASEFYKVGAYELEGKRRNTQALLEFYQDLTDQYPILFIEDPFAQNDWLGWQKANSSMPASILIMGDDLTTTNPERIAKAKEKEACTAVVLKPNQIGTVTETLQAAKLAKGFGWQILVSHRAGETGDDFIADLAVGISAEFIKSGAPVKKERIAKYSRLLQIEL